MAKICSHPDCYKNVFSDGYCKWHQWLSEKFKERQRQQKEDRINKAKKSKKVKNTTGNYKQLMGKVRVAHKPHKTTKIQFMDAAISELDYLFSKYIRQKNADQKGMVSCYTCTKICHWTEIQAGHYISRRYYQFRWDEFNVRPQCDTCNCKKDGNLIKYSHKLMKENMERFSDMVGRKNQLFKLYRSDIDEIKKDLVSKLDKNNFKY